jgi:hypothetical protein
LTHVADDRGNVSCRAGHDSPCRGQPARRGTKGRRRELGDRATDCAQPTRHCVTGGTDRARDGTGDHMGDHTDRVADGAYRSCDCTAEGAHHARGTGAQGAHRASDCPEPAQ